MQLEKLHEQVWVLHNFIEKSDLKILLSCLKLNSEDGWYSSDVNESSFWYGRNFQISNLSDSAAKIIVRTERVLGTVFTDYEKIHSIQSILRTISDGKSLGDHRDNAAEDDRNNMFGVVIYLNDDYEGGEIYYKDIGISYKPLAGDLVVHYAGLVHGVRKVLNGERYVLTSFVKGSSKTSFMGEVSGG